MEKRVRFCSVIAIVFIIASVLCSVVKAQMLYEQCGVIYPSGVELRSTLVHDLDDGSNDVRYFPIRHVVINVDKSLIGRDIFDEVLIDLNEAFAASRVQFYNDSIEYITTDDIVNGGSGFAMRHNQFGVINIYYCKEVFTGGVSVSGYGSLPWGITDHIAIKLYSFGIGSNKPGFNFAFSCLIHEMGHFFNLHHTHETMFGVEFVDGSNCDIAGDLCCDTPAEPYYEKIFYRGCAYIGTVTDVHGDLYHPDVRNYMSYNTQCAYHFTHDQHRRIYDASFMTSRIGLVSYSYVPMAIDEVDGEIPFHPNPVFDVIYIDNVDSKEVRVYSLGGILIRSSKGSTIDLSGESAGIYLLSIGDKTYKVIKR